MNKQLLLICSILLVNACTSHTTSESIYMHKGINFGQGKDADYKKGVRDACRPIDCGYTKDLKKLKNSESYRNGWKDGLLKCKGKETHFNGF